MFSSIQESRSSTSYETSPIRLLRLFKNVQRDDHAGKQVAASIRDLLKIDPGEIISAKLFTIDAPISSDSALRFADTVLANPLLHHIVARNGFEQSPDLAALQNKMQHAVVVSSLPGVTDDEGMSAQHVLMKEWLASAPMQEHQCVFSQSVWWIEKPLSSKDLQTICHEFLGNPLVHHFEILDDIADSSYVPHVVLSERNRTDTISLASLTEDELVKLSQNNLWALSADEMQAIRDHFCSAEMQATRASLGLPKEPFDCEMEILAQTWSEHCKHKEFAATIEYNDRETGKKETIQSLFKTFIEKTSRTIESRLKEAGHTWLVKIFNDNAGCVKANERQLFIWKVETHNSPSALDPYGGALTGIVGVNRDPLGTGRGGARLLFNTNVLCFGYPNDIKPLLPGQLHPRRILKGVCKGIEDGGNKSGVPTINGAMVFHDDFRGKPLVFCGTGALMPNMIAGLPAWEKDIRAGDRIVMAGGRVGRDGIHGATMSSIELDEKTPRSSVQIGSPFTQKVMADFLEEACAKGFIRTLTDNGAGGLSSSIGELATFTNGAEVQLKQVPLKYQGLRPWEIFVSESQERMTLAVSPQHMQDLRELAQFYDVEIADIGSFTSSGYLDVRYDETRVAYLSLSFLHDGVPRKRLEAEWVKSEVKSLIPPLVRRWNELYVSLMSRPNIASKEVIIRRYDHEVKGKTVLKPLMGFEGEAPQNAGVMRIDFSGWEGIAVSNGLYPRYATRDPYAASAGAFDEAVRQIIAIGGKLPDLTQSDNCNFWSANDNFCVPDSVYHPENNPDGKLKLGRLVKMCEALRDMSLVYNVPMTSGKDSMKNDLKVGDQKISVPPTVLYSIAAKIADVRRIVTSEFKAAGDCIYLVGQTKDEIGESEVAHLLHLEGGTIPQVSAQAALALYRKVMQAHDANLIVSNHDLSDGGLAAALAECCFGGRLGADVIIGTENLSFFSSLFSESHSRFLISIRPEDRNVFETIFGKDAQYLGVVSPHAQLKIWDKDEDVFPVVDIGVDMLEKAWRRGLEGLL